MTYVTPKVKETFFAKQTRKKQVSEHAAKLAKAFTSVLEGKLPAEIPTLQATRIADATPEVIQEIAETLPPTEPVKEPATLEIAAESAPEKKLEFESPVETLAPAEPQVKKRKRSRKAKQAENGSETKDTNNDPGFDPSAEESFLKPFTKSKTDQPKETKELSPESLPTKVKQEKSDWWVWWFTNDELTSMLEKVSDKTLKKALAKFKQLPGGGYVMGESKPITQSPNALKGCNGYILAEAEKASFEAMEAQGTFMPFYEA